MRVAVLGAGVIGLTTAYFLRQKGHEVIVIDRHSGPALECSFSNASQLSYCNAQPWANRAALKKGIKWMGQKNAPLRFRFRAMDFQMWQWLYQFVLNCNEKQETESTKHILNLCLYSQSILHKNEADFNFDFDYAKTGKLFVFETEKELADSLKQSRLQESLGAPAFQTLSFDEMLKYEPALAHMRGKLFGATRDPWDETGDAYKFCVGLEEKLKTMGVEFHYNTTITDFIHINNRIQNVITDKGNFSADSFVFSLGAYSPVIAKRIGIKIPVYPLKGYSITVPITNPVEAPATTLTYQKARTVFSRIGDRMRVSGTAEFAGYDHTITPNRVQMLKDLTQKVFPNAGDINSASEWACLRPATPDFRPVISNSKYENMIINTGQGALGWTMAFASGKISCDIVEGKKPEIDITPFALDRF